MGPIEEAIVKVYLLQRDRLREEARTMVEQAPDVDVPPIWVVPMDVPAIDKLVGGRKPYLYFDRGKGRFTHIVHAWAMVVGPAHAGNVFPVQRVITIPETAG
jgi:hypothetical protein